MQSVLQAKAPQTNQNGGCQMRFFIVSIIAIVLSGLAFGWLIVNHPYIAECLIVSMVCVLTFALLGSMLYNVIKEE